MVYNFTVDTCWKRQKSQNANLERLTFSELVKIHTMKCRARSKNPSHSGGVLQKGLTRLVAI
jgi:hypothetical protein